MTMVPAPRLLKQQQYYCDGYGSCGDSYSGSNVDDLMSRLGAGYDPCTEAACLGSDLLVGHMAEEDSRTTSLNEAGSSSREAQEEKDEGWLQLGIGGHVAGRAPVDEPAARRGGLVELDLLSLGATTSSGVSAQHVKPLAPIFRMAEPGAPRPTSLIGGTPLLFQHPRISLGFPQMEFPWGYRSSPWNLPSPSSPSSSSSPMLPGPFYARHFQHPGLDVAGPSSDMRVVVDAPPRPHSGVWFVLQASKNQAKEPFLPQIPKSFLRIKDGRMSVRLLMKYLVNKLRLDSESEVEITCRGQELLPFWTLQHVRDNIWSSRDAVTLLPDSSTTDHVMILHYGRSA